MGKIVKIFVSSVFQEMEIERDVLHHQVNAYLKEKVGDDITPLFVDLRWGIDTRKYEDDYQRSMYIINRCFDAIDDSDIFLGLLGNEYGSTAEKEIVESLDLDDLHKEVSYTHLEILYAEKHLPKENILFLIKDGKGSSSSESLKEYVKDKYQYLTYEKTGEDSISPSFISNAIKLLEPHLSSSHKKEYYYQRDDVINSVIKCLDKSNFIAIKGEFGSGKTTLLKWLKNKYQDTHQCIFINDSVRYSFRRVFKGKSFEESLEIMRNDNKRYVILFDAYEYDSFRDFYALYASFINQKDKFIMFFTYENDESIKRLFGMDIAYFDMPLLSKEDIAPFIEEVMKVYNKLLFNEVNEYLINKGDRYLTPMALITIISELIALDGSIYSNVRNNYLDYSSGMVEMMKKIIDSFPKTNKGIIPWKISNADKYISPDLARFITNVIEIYQQPLELSLLSRCFEKYFNRHWSDIDYYTYKSYLRGIVNEEDGLISFSIHLPYLEKIDEERVNKIKVSLYESLKEMNLHKNKELEFAYSVDLDYFIKSVNDGICLDDIALAIDTSIISFDQLSKINALAYQLVKNSGSINHENLLRALIKSFSYGFIYIDRIYTYHKCLINNFYFKVDELLLMDYYGCFIDFSLSNGLEKYITKEGDILFNYVDKNTAKGKDIEIANKISELTYICYKYLDAIDDKRCQDLYDNLASNILALDNCPFYALTVVEELNKKHLFIAEKVMNHLLNIIDNNKENDAFLELGIHNIKVKEMLGIPNNLDNTAPYIKEFYDLAKAYYEKHSSLENAIYYYAVASQLYFYYEVTQYNEEGKKKAIRDSYNLRLLLCNLSMDNFNYIYSLSLLVMNICMHGPDIGIPLKDIINQNYDLLKRYAIRGNLRVGWLFSNWFKALSENKDAVTLLIDKIKEIDIFLNDIIKINLTNNEYLMEIMQSYLEIYHNYCEHRILPLEDGRNMLDRMYHIGKQLLKNDSCEETYYMFTLIYEEIFAIMMQQGPDAMMEDEIYIDAKKVFKKIKENDKSIIGQLYGSYQDLLDIIATITLAKDMQNRGMPFSLLKSMGFDVFDTIYSYVDSLTPILMTADKEGVNIRRNCVIPLIYGLDFIIKNCLDNEEMVNRCKEYYNFFISRINNYK